MKPLSRFALLAGCCALTLIAEDFWLKKPYTDWGDKEAVKLLQNSPWARQVSVSLGGPAQATDGGGGGRGGSRGGGGGGGMGSGMGDATAGAMDSPNMNGPNSGGRGGAGGQMESLGGGPSILVTVRWQSALPVRQALVVSKLGREKATSEEASKFLNQELPGYILALIGLPAEMARIPAERLNEIAKTSTALHIKDKDPIPALKAEAVSRDKLVEIYFVFPKTSPITLDDKEVEFAVSVGHIEVKRKFKLKDMMVGDKLEL